MSDTFRPAHGLTRAPAPALLLFLAVAPLPLLAAQQPVDEALRGWLKLAPPQQELRAAAMQSACDAVDDPWLQSVRAAATAAAAPRTPRTDRFPRHTPKRRPADWEPLLPGEHRYVFGLGVVEPAPEIAKLDKAAHALAVRRAGVELAVAGLLPNSDAALAGLLAQLDADRGADRFAAFLESWRNGDESFYEALDRTAGTKDGVFFFDVMIDEWSAAFGHGATAGSRGGRQQAHDAMHGAFLAYRQYRAFREAAALSLLLPPDRPLPVRLQRYEAKVAGAYSLREQLQMVLAVEGYDVLAVARLIAAAARPLPEPLWSAQYDPYPSWQPLFNERIGRMIDAAQSTDAFLQQARAHLVEVAQGVADAAHKALAENVSHGRR